MNTGRYILIKRTSPLLEKDVVDDLNEKLLSAGDVVGQAHHRAKTFGMKLCEDFPPALSDMKKGESVMVASAKDGTGYLFVLKVTT